MKSAYKIITLAFAALLVLASCKKEKNEPGFDDQNLAPLSIEFDNIVGGQNLYLNTGSYTDAAGESFSVSLLQYFISNIKVRKADGTEYVVPQDSSYFLIKEGDEDLSHAVVNVPEGDYTTLTFTVGVDSLRSTMDVSKRTGVLDPSGSMADGMYWGWNSGYIFFKMEGLSDAAPVDPSGQHKFRYHIGGFGGYNAPTINNIKTITLDLSERGVAKPRKDRKANIHLMVDISKVLSGSTTVSIAANPEVMFSDYSVNIANNYAQMFRHDHTEN
ncbi:MbnP family protein [Taibaiella koreensis]|uniref:MbnP family protein n=1 Tax=Taibaiella koreensis TaxID=1268548 RepID=UPI000E59DB52|nr:MbnP family protein [Taibaiella koreensis]